ncbi:glycosyltransferase family 4 protein [Paracoccus sp. (in: a-proteobacteria)]|uniref:glycosyltransferase family 4 protein n=1 Tax=Paracoccus sp. TaxID=267 RepID=UPI003A888D64
MQRRLRALLIAEAANPEWVSVPLVGWSVANALREVADVHLVTQIRNRKAILRTGMAEGSDFTAIDSEKIAMPLWKLASKLRMGKSAGWTINQFITSFSYGYFERLVWRRFGPAIRAGEYDLVHRLTPLSPAVNSSLATKCARAGVPFLLGPINGGVPWPPGFASEQRREREWLSNVRGLYRFRPARARMLRAASAILCGSRFALAEIPKQYSNKTIYLPENAIDPARFNQTAPQNGRLPLRVCFVGRLVPLKGVDMALTAMAPLLRSGALTFDIIGDGSQGQALRNQVEREGLPGVTFHGWQDHQKVQSIAATCQLFLFPSIREFGGGAVLEAMSLGVVPVVLNYAGPGELVDDSTGYRIPLGSRAEVIAALSGILQSIADDPAPLYAKARAAQARVRADFTWSAKAEQILNLWQAVLDGQSPLPQVMRLPD